jgi:dethiobiotin synthetase
MKESRRENLQPSTCDFQPLRFLSVPSVKSVVKTQAEMLPRTIFITGTDTGVGKTLLTGLLLSHLRQNGSPVLALKPFCSGNRADAELLHSLQDGELSLDEINPFFFSEPLAPLVAARKHSCSVNLKEVLVHINAISARHLASIKNHPARSGTKVKKPSYLLVEGAGGLLAPLGEGYTALDLIQQLRCSGIVVARNGLGTLNHSLLTIRALQAPATATPTFSGPPTRAEPYPSHFVPHFVYIASKSQPVKDLDVPLQPTESQSLKVVLMSQKQDLSSASNASILTELLVPLPIFSIPNLGRNAAFPGPLKVAAKKLKKTLAQVLA